MHWKADPVLAEWHTGIHKGCSNEAPRSLPVVVEIIGRCVVFIIPRALRNTIPPCVSISDLKSGESATDFDGLVGSHSLAQCAIRSCVVHKGSCAKLTSCFDQCTRRRRNSREGRGPSRLKVICSPHG